eukprot:s505_g1.t2
MDLRSGLIQKTLEGHGGAVTAVEGQRCAKKMDSLHLGQLRFQEQVGAVSQMKEEMLKWDSQRKIYEAAVDESLEAFQHKLDAQRFALEQKESTLHHLNRNLDRVASEVNRLLEDQDAVREVCESRVDEQSKRLNQFKAEAEVRFATMERQHNALSDELWGDELSLAKVAGELKKTNATFGKLEDAVAALQDGKAEAVQLEKLRADVAKMVHEANTATSQMRQTVGEVVNDVREHFRTASETVASHNASFVKQVREEYQAELERSSELREEETPREDTQDWGDEADEDEDLESLDEEEDGVEGDSQESDGSSASAGGDTSEATGSQASGIQRGGSSLWDDDASDARDGLAAASSDPHDPKHDRIQQLQRMLGQMRKEKTAKTFVTRREQIGLKRQQEPEGEMGEAGEKPRKGRGRGRGKAKGRGKGRGARAGTKGKGSGSQETGEDQEDKEHEDEEEEEGEQEEEEVAEEEPPLRATPGRSKNMSKERQVKAGKEEKALSAKKDVSDDGQDHKKVKKGRHQKKDVQSTGGRGGQTVENKAEGKHDDETSSQKHEKKAKEVEDEEEEGLNGEEESEGLEGKKESQGDEKTHDEEGGKATHDDEEDQDQPEDEEDVKFKNKQQDKQQKPGEGGKKKESARARKSKKPEGNDAKPEPATKEAKRRSKKADQNEKEDADKQSQEKGTVEDAAPKKKPRTRSSENPKKRTLRSETGGSSPVHRKKGKSANAEMKEAEVKDPQPKAPKKKRAAKEKDGKKEDEAGTEGPAEVEKPKQAQCFARRPCPKGSYTKAKWISLRKSFEEKVKPHVTTYSKHEDMDLFWNFATEQWADLNFPIEDMDAFASAAADDYLLQGMRLDIGDQLHEWLLDPGATTVDSAVVASPGKAPESIVAPKKPAAAKSKGKSKGDSKGSTPPPPKSRPVATPVRKGAAAHEDLPTPPQGASGNPGPQKRLRGKAPEDPKDREIAELKKAGWVAKTNKLTRKKSRAWHTEESDRYNKKLDKFLVVVEEKDDEVSDLEEDTDKPVNFRLKAAGNMAPPDVGAESETDVSEEEEGAKQTNGPKQELWEFDRFKTFGNSLLGRSAKISDLISDLEALFEASKKGSDTADGKRVAKSIPQCVSNLEDAAATLDEEHVKCEMVKAKEQGDLVRKLACYGDSFDASAFDWELSKPLGAPAKHVVEMAGAEVRENPGAPQDLKEFSRVRLEDAEVGVHEVLRKYGLTCKVQIDTTNLGPDQLKEFPYIKLSSWFQYLTTARIARQFCGVSSFQKMKRVLGEFWKRYQRVHPNHDIFRKARQGALDLESTIPYFSHSDEGRAYKKEALWIFSVHGCLGRGTSLFLRKGKHKAPLHRNEMGLNFVGQSLSTQFIFTTVLRETATEHPGMLQSLLKLFAEDAKVKSFMMRASQSVETLELRVDEVGSKANALAAEAREELEDLNRRRKRDKTSAENELLGGFYDASRIRSETWDAWM